ncbi:putative signal peptide-containing protein [Cryptosporidium canis]|nr:putative signal peptide-containing protein [Cryptosporidium canis]
MSKKTYILGAIGCIILAIGGALGTESSPGSDLFGSSSSDSQVEASASLGSSDLEYPSISGEGSQSNAQSTEEMVSGVSGEASPDLSKTGLSAVEDISTTSGPTEQLDFGGGEPSEKSASKQSLVEATLSDQNRLDFSESPREISKHEERSAKVELVITRSAEVAIESLFPPVESASALTVGDIHKYPSVELRDEKVLESQISKVVNFYKVDSPMTHDTISGLSTSDPRVEIGVNSGFDLFVNENQPRMERILRFIDSKSLEFAEQERMDLAVLLFSVAAYGECVKKLSGFSQSLDIVDFCTQLSREDVLTILPEDLPKNVLKEKVELFKLSGLVMSIPFPIFTSDSSLKWRHAPHPNGIYQVYNSGAIDGFAHFDFLYKKIHDITTFLHSPGFQMMDDVRVDLYYGLKAIRSQLGHAGQTKAINKDISKLTDFFVNWFKNPKSKKQCSKDYFEATLALGPVYAAIHELNKILRSIQREASSDPGVLEREFSGISKHALINVNFNERKFITNNIVPILVMTYKGIAQGKAVSIRTEILRILAILEEIEFNSQEVSRAQQKLQKCFKHSDSFRNELSGAKRVFYRLVKAVRKSNPKFPFPLPSSPLYIKGVKFGIKNIFRKNLARSKLGYYQEIQPFDKSRRSSKK